MPYSPSFRDRYLVRKEDQEEAARFAASAASRLGLEDFRRIGVIGVYVPIGAHISPQVGEARLTFYFRTFLETGTDYLGRIHFHLIGDLRFNDVEWQARESSGDVPTTLEELIENGLPGASIPEFRTEAQRMPAFFEIYLGIYQRLFPTVEPHELHTDTGFYDEASSSHVKKELWRTDLLTRLQGLRFPKLEIEEPGFGVDRGTKGVRVSWEPQGHTNYTIWFNLYIGEDPKVAVYVDPTQSGSTTGWLSTRLIKNENALEKLPYTLEQWAVEDLRTNTAKKGFHPGYRKAIRELLLHHLPRDMEEVWAAIRRQIVGVRPEELHTDVAAYDESLMESLKNAK